MVISATIANWRVHNTLVDKGISANVLYWSIFLKLNLPLEMVKSYPDPLVRFVGERVHTRGFMDLLTTFGSGRTHRTLTVRYLLVEANMSYNVLIGRSTLNTLGAIVYTPHMAMKFPSE